ncbi:MAG TPA: O-antigen ligase family protein [Ktedonobacterales bacterium]|nr:O-antigen ligase family protein [Ktedonobacterales bacterium]
MKAARRLFAVTFVMALMFEALPFSTDPIAMIGWYLHQDIKKWLPIGLPFSLMELLLLAAAVCWLARGPKEKRTLRYGRGRLTTPVVAFTAAVALGVLWGLVHGGDNLTFALFEVRGLAMLVFAYLLVGMLFREDRDLGPLIWCMLIACAGLALQDLYRYFFIYSRSITSDLMFEHEDSLILAFGAVLCLTLLAFNGTRLQRRWSLLLFPVFLVCLAVMRRRAAWPVLIIGLVVLAIMLLRARPKVFWRVVPVVALLGIAYLGIFWNSNSALGQPARAVRSQISPDPRDASSDLYRQIEHYDIIANIRSSRVLGLGFGQPYIFYESLPDLSFWPFWHYESHNSVLWLWMDGGIPVFFTFMWLAGAALASGGQELNARREVWTPQFLTMLRARRRGGARASGSTPARASYADLARRAPAHVAAGGMAGSASSGISKLDIRAHAASTALLVAAVCFIPMQIVYSYVDLGLINPRDMLLYGVALGIVGRSFTNQPVASRSPRPGGRARKIPAAPDATPPRPAGPLVAAPSR